LSSDPNLRKYSYYFSLFMVLVYVCLGSLLLFFDVPLNVTREGKQGAGIILILYGSIRAWLNYRKWKKKQDEEE
jgi:hypothetical protein